MRRTPLTTTPRRIIASLQLDLNARGLFNSPVMRCTALATRLNMYRASLMQYAPNPIASGLRHMAMTAMAPADRL